jgi:hypothetical protein
MVCGAPRVEDGLMDLRGLKLIGQSRIQDGSRGLKDPSLARIGAGARLGKG